jgi:hypothetical protein
MKKLTENEAYAYIERDGLDTAMSALTLTAPNDDDDDDAADPLLQIWKNFENFVGDCFDVSDWKVEFPQNTPTEQDRLLLLSKDQSLLRTVLIHSYKRTLLKWIKTTTLSDSAIEPTRDDYQAFLSGGKIKPGYMSAITSIILEYAVDMPSFNTRYRVNIDGVDINLQPDHTTRNFRLTYRGVAEQLRRDMEQIKTIGDCAEVYVLEEGYFMKFTRESGSIFSSDFAQNMKTTFTSAASTVGKTIFEKFFPVMPTVADPGADV